MAIFSKIAAEIIAEIPIYLIQYIEILLQLFISLSMIQSFRS